MDVAIPFTIKIRFIIYAIVMDNPKLSEIILNVPVDKLSIDRTTSYGIQSTASSTFCPEVSQGQAIIIGCARQVTSD